MKVKSYLKWKNIIAGFLVVLLMASSALLTSAFVYKKNGAQAAVKHAAGNAHVLKKDTFKVYGLTCGDTFCVTSIQNALYKIKGVVSVNVNIKVQEVIVKFNGNIPPDTFVKAIDGASNAIFHYSAHIYENK